MASPHSIKIDLGTNTLVSDSSDLLLIINSLAELQIPPESQITAEAIHSGDIWIDQSPELSLHIHATAESGLGHPLSLFISRAGDALCKSKLWACLDRAVLFKSCNQHVDHHTSSFFHLTFGVRRTPGRLQPSNIPRIPARIQVNPNIHPPVGVPTAALSTLDVLFEYRKSAPQLQPHIAQLIVPADMSTRVDEMSHNQGCDVMSIERSGALSFERESHYIQNKSVQRHALPDYKGVTLQREMHPHHSDEFNTLFNTGLRTIFTGASSRSDNDDKHPRSLLTHFPAIFNPGFHESLSQRVHFISSIAKSMDDLLKYTDIGGLQKKISSLRTPHNTSPESLPVDIKAKLKMCFWHIAHRQLRKMRPPHTFRAIDIIPVLHGSTQPFDDLLFSESTLEESTDAQNREDEGSSDQDDYIGTDEEWVDSGATSLLSMNDDALEYADNRYALYNDQHHAETKNTPLAKNVRCEPCLFGLNILEDNAQPFSAHDQELSSDEDLGDQENWLLEFETINPTREDCDNSDYSNMLLDAL